MELETSRLRVRPFRPGDLEALAEILGDSLVMTFIEPPYTRDQTEDFLAWAGMGERPLVYAVEEICTGALAGQLIWHPWEGTAWELGWILGRGFWGRGYARELTARVLARARKLGIASVVLECHPDQRATAAIAQDCGFGYQGRREGLDLWKIDLPPAKEEKENNMDQIWLEVTIDTTAAGIEPVCAYLTALGVGGLVVEEEADFEQFADENKSCWDEVDEALKQSRQGANRVKCYLTDDEDGHARLEELKSGLPAFRARTEADCGSLEVSLQSLQEEDWAHNWQKYYEAFPVGDKLYIVPEWERGNPVPQGRTPVYLNPGLIFGTGSHGTTRLCLEGLEHYVVPGQPVLDLGCGSGILAIAALVLGASQAKGCDIDPKAVRVAEENAGFNGVEDRLQVFCGDVTGDEALVRNLEGKYPLVLANIIADVIIPLSGHVGQFLAPGGVFLCSGIIAHRAEDVQKALEENGFAIFQRQEREGWVSFAARRA